MFTKTGTKPNLTNGGVTMKTIVAILAMFFLFPIAFALAEDKSEPKIQADICYDSYIAGGIPEIPKYQLVHGRETFLRYFITQYRPWNRTSFNYYKGEAQKAWDCYGEINWRRCVSDSNVRECIKLLKEEY